MSAQTPGVARTSPRGEGAGRVDGMGVVVDEATGVTCVRRDLPEQRRAWERTLLHALRVVVPGTEQSAKGKTQKLARTLSDAYSNGKLTNNTLYTMLAV